MIRRTNTDSQSSWLSDGCFGSKSKLNFPIRCSFLWGGEPGTGRIQSSGWANVLFSRHQICSKLFGDIHD